MDKIFKNILPFTIIPIFVFIFAYSISENNNNIEITVRTPEIENRNVILKLIKEINDKWSELITDINVKYKQKRAELISLNDLEK